MLLLRLMWFSGYSLKNHVLMEKPGVSFNYKYLLLANKDYNIDPVVCSTFKTYKDNEIKDDCILIKVLLLWCQKIILSTLIFVNCYHHVTYTYLV